MPAHPVRGSMVVRRRHTAVVAAVMSCSTVLTAQGPVEADGASIPSVPAPQLEWRPCVPGSPFDCATAQVPLDHAAPGGRSVDLAVVRRKATGPGKRVGTLFFNPGGPGGPGTVQMPQNYAFFPREVRERFDIVSWDPRGIGNSTAVNCFTSPREAADWNASKAVGFPVGEKEQKAFTAAYADLVRRCEKTDPELLRHVSTADTARDLDLLRRSVGEPQLNYYGISYGTILGATYANLFPGKVRAMTLDSNIGPRAWTNDASDDARLTTFLRVGSDRSAAATLDRFLDLCGSTTTARCAFSAGTPKATRDKFDRLTERLRKEPVDTWTYARTVADAVNSLYLVSGWSDLAGRLQELWRGRAPEPAAFPPAPPVPDPDPYLGEEQAAAVLCGDSPDPRDPGVYPLLEEASAARAGDAGRFWTWATAGCTGWPASPDRYTGPWDERTANPVLVVGTTYDPSTAYPNSRAMAEELADARLLTNEGYGHTALLNPSTCVQDHESRYFVDGVLPPAGTTCRQDTPPFTAPKPSGGVAAGGGALAVGLS
ncbi:MULTISPECIES: alpha/beta hydrolase [Streptomyces]|uniref:alpha/beta hydrolase n=1 Tax=Streptomyces TaxID=1883 RepID=UPI002E14986D|nr:alpha/beta hydrolase [[Kitasatospora] papulosa]